VVGRAYFARRFLALRALRGALVAGALYDAWLAGMLLWRPGVATTQLGLGEGVMPPMATVAAIWLAMLAGLGIAAGRDFRRYSAVIAALVCGRGSIAAALATGALVTGSSLPGAVAWNAVLAVVLAAGWWPQRG
jgi:hypothetical protein